MSGASLSSSGRRRSTTSVSCPRSSGSRTPFASRQASQVDLEVPLGDERLPSRSRRRSTASCRKPSPTSSSTRARRASASSSRASRAAVVLVEDDGTGFDPTALNGGLGLVGMRERIGLVGGRFDVESRPRKRDDARRGGSASDDDSRPRRRRSCRRPRRPPARARCRGGHRDRRRGGERRPRRVRGARGEARRRAHGRRHAGQERDRRDAGAAPGRPRGEGPRSLDAGRPALRPRGVRSRRLGYVLKEAADTELVAAIRAVAGGGSYVHPTLGARLVAADADERREPRPTRSPSASARCSACWRSGTRIRRSRRCSSSRCAPPRRTAPTSCRSSLKSRAELVRYALAEGLLEE